MRVGRGPCVMEKGWGRGTREAGGSQRVTMGLGGCEAVGELSAIAKGEKVKQQSSGILGSVQTLGQSELERRKKRMKVEDI